MAQTSTSRTSDRHADRDDALIEELATQTRHSRERVRAIRRERRSHFDAIRWLAKKIFRVKG